MAVHLRQHLRQMRRSDACSDIDFSHMYGRWGLQGTARPWYDGQVDYSSSRLRRRVVTVQHLV